MLERLKRYMKTRMRSQNCAPSRVDGRRHRCSRPYTAYLDGDELAAFTIGEAEDMMDAEAKT
jgi:hypothetical protein